MASRESLTSYPKEKIKILLLEGVHRSAHESLGEDGFTVESQAGVPGGSELARKVDGIHVLGIRSKTRITPEILSKARRLLAIGCFCIGTDQVNLEQATALGIPVFNSPFSNTRSVAELVIGEIIVLLRRIFDKSRAAHEGEWQKEAKGCFEVRNKRLGIVGYGHIGSQVSILAEALGMQVFYYDIVDKLPMGNAVRMQSLEKLLKSVDIVSLHVPEDKATTGMIGEGQLDRMKDGGYLINASRGKVVDLDALARALHGGKLAGAAVDVFPEEPKGTGEKFACPLQGIPNVILTPHVGGSTKEAQENIARDLSAKLIRFINNGSTMGCVNIPQVHLPVLRDHHRILHIHRNVPGVLSKVNDVFSKFAINVESQYLKTNEKVGYLIVDVKRDISDEVFARIKGIEETIKARILY
ncbi:MAG: phosphoglycerate dehydrogenase [Armatimonadetes bacterium]|nr:phosphoglycerate dehydrogenase [Armatimonadota bacterium]